MTSVWHREPDAEDLQAVTQARRHVLAAAEHLRFHHPEAVLAFLRPQDVLDDEQRPSRAQQAVRDVLGDHPALGLGERRAHADAGAGLHDPLPDMRPRQHVITQLLRQAAWDQRHGHGA